MTTSIRNLTLAAMAGLALTLSACGGGGGSGPVTGGGNMPIQPGQTSPVAVKLGSLTNISSIHLEMSDLLFVSKGGVLIDKDNIQGGPVTVRDTVRWEMVCPGVPPRGNECTSPTFKIDGTRYNAIEAEDWSIDVQAKLLETMINRPSLFGGSNNGIQLYSGTIRPIDLSFEVLGGWGKYFGMLSMRSNRQFDFQEVRTNAASFGMLYSGYPIAAQGSATWYGPMVGHTRRDGIELAGDAELQYDFSANEVDLTLLGIDVSSLLSPHTYNGPNTMQWTDLRVNADGSFYIPGYGNDRAGTDLHPTLGYVDGDFYGPNAEEMAGVFERAGVVGAFGGRRSNQ